MRRGGGVVLTPLDIHQKEFRRSFRGYNEREVDEFLDEVVRDFELLLKENAELRDQLEEMHRQLEHYRHLEETLNRALVVAQETADEVKANARREAELIIKEAERRAEQMAEQARERVRQLEEEYRELRSEVRSYRARMRALAHSLLELFAEAEREEELEDTRIVSQQ